VCGCVRRMERRRGSPVDLLGSTLRGTVMADAPNKAETPNVRENKSSAFRWAIGLVAALALGVIAWLIANPRSGEPIDPAPQHQPGVESESGASQPSAVIPNQDPSAEPVPPASSGAGTQ
jgi:hypothetical protein